MPGLPGGSRAAASQWKCVHQRRRGCASVCGDKTVFCVGGANLGPRLLFWLWPRAVTSLPDLHPLPGWVCPGCPGGRCRLWEMVRNPSGSWGAWAGGTIPATLPWSLAAEKCLWGLRSGGGSSERGVSFF